MSGSHSTGKSTLIAAFLAKCPGYLHEPEAFESLADDVELTSSEGPTAEGLQALLEHTLSSLALHPPGSFVVFERSPADYVAYLQALEDLSRETADARLTERAIETAREAMAMLDLIVYLPCKGGGPEMEDPELGGAVDVCLEGILVNDDLSLFGGSRPLVIEAAGTTAQRLRLLEVALR